MFMKSPKVGDTVVYQHARQAYVYQPDSMMRVMPTGIKRLTVVFMLSLLLFWFHFETYILWGVAIAAIALTIFTKPGHKKHIWPAACLIMACFTAGVGHQMLMNINDNTVRTIEQCNDVPDGQRTDCAKTVMQGHDYTVKK